MYCRPCISFVAVVVMLIVQAFIVGVKADEWYSLQCLLNYLHTTTKLPTKTQAGATVTWTLASANEELLSLDGNKLVVGTLPQGDKVQAGTLTATIDGGETRDFTVTVAPNDNMYGYLYCYMKKGKEITNYALGTKTGKAKRFNELLGGAEIFDNYKLAEIQHGTRDAFLQRGQKPNQYLLTTTDMSSEMTGHFTNWGINLMTSPDLIHWESTTFDFRLGKKIFSDPKANTGCYRTNEEYSRIYRVWAPEFIWDPDYDEGRGGYLVVYSILSSNDWDHYDRLYYSYADSDFKTLTQPRLFFDAGCSAIDANITLNPYDGLYHMYFKRTGGDGGNALVEMTSPKLLGGEWTQTYAFRDEGRAEIDIEGPETVRRINEDAYNFYFMRFGYGNDYKVCSTDHIGQSFTSPVNLPGVGSFQHGSVITVTEDEYKMLEAWSELVLLLKEVDSFANDPMLAEAVAVANHALEHRTVNELVQVLPQALADLKAAVADYKARVKADLAEGRPTELTIMLTNPSFADGIDGWTNDGFTAFRDGVVEFYDRTFSLTQKLSSMPAGTYRLTARGYYRNGPWTEAYTAHKSGSEELLAVLTLGKNTAPLMSIYDNSVSSVYKYSPYTYPDNLSMAVEAINDKGLYTENSVEYEQTRKISLTLGVKKDTHRSADWTVVSDLHLYYLGAPDAVTTCEADEKPAVAYDLQGRRVENPSNGIYIIGGRKVVK